MPASWVAGFLVSLFAASGVAVNLLFSSEWGHLSALVIGAGFIPALALTLGSWSGSSRLFEIIYLIWWYLINNGSTALDFMGTSEASLNAGRPLFFLIFGLALLGMSAIGRWQKLQS
jgi:hypothetical protein